MDKNYIKYFQEMFLIYLNSNNSCAQNGGRNDLANQRYQQWYKDKFKKKISENIYSISTLILMLVLQQILCLLYFNLEFKSTAILITIYNAKLTLLITHTQKEVLI